MARKLALSLDSTTLATSLVFGTPIALPKGITKCRLQAEVAFKDGTSKSIHLQVQVAYTGGLGYAPVLVTRHGVLIPGGLAEHVFTEAKGGTAQIENLSTSEVDQAAMIKIGAYQPDGAAQAGDSINVLLIY